MKTSPILFSVLLALTALPTAALAADDEKIAYEFKIETVNPQPAMTMRFTSTPEALGENYGKALPAVFAYVAANGGQITGMPFGHYLAVKDGKLEVEAGVPVAKTIAEKGKIKASRLPGGTVITTVHVGPYEKLGDAHQAIYAWAKENGKKPAGGVWEYYLTDPGQESEPSKYRTKLFLPITAEGTSKSN